MNTLATNQKTVLARQRQHAFTLVEMLAVIAVMLIVLRLTLPSLDGLLGSDAEGMARTQLIGELNKARSMALERGGSVQVVFMPLYDDILPRNNAKAFYFSSNSDANRMLGAQLVGYALYSESQPGDQPGKPTPKWLTDWEFLPSGYFLSSEDLYASCPSRVRVKNLANNSQDFNGELELPAIAYNSRGQLKGAGLRGVYLPVIKGGVFPPVKDQNGKYSVTSADPPDQSSIKNLERYWLRVGAVTGRAVVEELSEAEAAAGLDLSDRLNSKYDVYIYNAPEWPADFNSQIPKNNSWYRANWAGNPPWSVSNGGYTIPTTAGLVYSQVPTKRDAVQLKWQLERIAGGGGNKKIGVRIDSVK